MTTPIKITPESQPTFPCWLWHTFKQSWERREYVHDWPDWKFALCEWSHWSPDFPTAPSAPPDDKAPQPDQAVIAAREIQYQAWHDGEIAALKLCDRKTAEECRQAFILNYAAQRAEAFLRTQIQMIEDSKQLTTLRDAAGKDTERHDQ